MHLPHTPGFLQCEFVIVGGGIAGLTAAIALARVDHNVTVLESLPSEEQHERDGGIRIPPNATKVLYRWGLEERLHKRGVTSMGMMFANYESGSVVGEHDWEEDHIDETGGDFLLMHYTDLRKSLVECAREHGAKVRFGQRVTAVTADPTRPSVTLESGEVLEADVVVCADGINMPHAMMRHQIMDALEMEDEDEEHPSGMQVFNCLIPESLMELDEDEKELVDLRKTGMAYTWFGKEDAAIGFPVDNIEDEWIFTLFVYAPLRTEAAAAAEPGREALIKILHDASPALQKLVKMADKVFQAPIMEREMLEEWVHPDGRVIAIGEAAHPLIPGSIYAMSLATGDAAVLGRLFKHLHRKDQIDGFLNAVQEIREPRIQRLNKMSKGDLFSLLLPPGVAAEARAKGRGDKNFSHTEVHMAVMDVFAYDPEDEADEWWQEWGLMQERASSCVVEENPWDIHEDVDESVVTTSFATIMITA